MISVSIHELDSGSVLFRNHLLLEHSINPNQARAHFQNAQIACIINVLEHSILSLVQNADRIQENILK